MTEAASAEAVLAVLAEAGREQVALRELPVDDAPDIVLAFDDDPATWFDTWEVLRTAVDHLRLWPVATATWGVPFESITRWEMQGPDGLDVTPSAILARTPTVDIDSLLDRERARQAAEWSPGTEDLAWMISQSGLVGVDLAALHQALGPTPDHLEVERWLLDLEIEQSVGDEVEPDTRYLDWFVPDDVVMLLVPTTEPWGAAAFVGGFEWGHPHTDLRAAVLRRWHQRHGAELAANWGTMVQLVVRRPPSTIEEAWTVAYETSLLWPDTAGGANGVATRSHARDLVGRPDWFLHFRP